jgi:hypothetical protein
MCFFISENMQWKRKPPTTKQYSGNGSQIEQNYSQKGGKIPNEYKNNFA